jgi:hypothetical protein
MTEEASSVSASVINTTQWCFVFLRDWFLVSAGGLFFRKVLERSVKIIVLPYRGLSHTLKVLGITHQSGALYPVRSKPHKMTLYHT